MVGSEKSENFSDFDSLDWLKLHSLNSEFRHLLIDEI